LQYQDQERAPVVDAVRPRAEEQVQNL
jgi:hypothetical protein